MGPKFFPFTTFRISFLRTARLILDFGWGPALYNSPPTRSQLPRHFFASFFDLPLTTGRNDGRSRTPAKPQPNHEQRYERSSGIE